MDVHSILVRATEEWNRGAHYESHETLEELVELLEERGSDRDRTIALALVRAAACLHKLIHGVGAGAVPGKLKGVLVDLEGAPDAWNGLDLGRLRGALTALSAALDRGEGLKAPPELAWSVEP